MFIDGFVGYFLRKYGYSLLGIVMGVVLGQIGGSAFRKAMIMVDFNPADFFLKPISCTLILLGIASILYNFIRQCKGIRPKININGFCFDSLSEVFHAPKS